jgi:hypothetical protein
VFVLQRQQFSTFDLLLNIKSLIFLTETMISVPGFFAVDGGNVVLDVILVLGRHITVGLRTRESGVAVHCLYTHQHIFYPWIGGLTEYTECQAFSPVVRISSPRPHHPKACKCCPLPHWFRRGEGVHQGLYNRWIALVAQPLPFVACVTHQRRWEGMDR